MELVDPNVPPPSNPLSYYQVNETHYHDQLWNSSATENCILFRNSETLCFYFLDVVNRDNRHNIRKA